MDIMQVVRRALNRMTLDEVLAISPRFMESVESAETRAIKETAEAEKETAEATAAMEAASLKSKAAKRTTKAVARVRQIHGG